MKDKPEHSQYGWRSVALVLMLVCASVLCTAYTLGSGDSGNSIPVVIESGSGVETASYIIYKDGSYTCAKNGTTGRVIYREVSSSDVINDTTSLVNGSVIYIAPGIYYINVFIQNSVILTGAGNSTKLIRDVQSLPVIRIDSADNITIEHLMIDGTADTTTNNYSMVIRNCSDVLIQHNYFIDGGNMRTLEIIDRDSPNSTWNALAEIARIRVLYNVFDQNTRNAIGSVCAHDVQIIGNIIYNAPDTAIEMSGGGNIHDAIISDNQIIGAHSGIIVGELNYSEGPRIVISNNVLYNISANGINVQNVLGDETLVGGVVVNGNMIYDDGSGFCGVIVMSVPNVQVSNNYIHGFDTGAIRINDGSMYASVTGNTIRGHTSYGIFIIEDHASVIGNSIFGILTSSYADGIWVRGNYSLIQSNGFYNCSQSIKLASGYSNNVVSDNIFSYCYAGILLDSSSYNTISGNVFKNQTTNGEVTEQGTSNYNIIVQNDFPDKYGIIKTGANTIIHENTGYYTELAGTATISSGQSSKIVSHNMPSAPTYVIVTGSSTETSACWVTDIGSTTFTINVPSAVSGNTVVYWYAVI